MPDIRFVRHSLDSLPLFLSSKILIPRTPIPRHISYVVVLQYRQNLVRQRAHDLDRVDTREVCAQALPLGDPGCGRVANSDERVEDGGCAFRNCVGRVLQLQEGLTIGAAGADELLDWGRGKGVSDLEERKGREKGGGVGVLGNQQWWF
jgi:hypothetical protein